MNGKLIIGMLLVVTSTYPQNLKQYFTKLQKHLGELNTKLGGNTNLSDIENKLQNLQDKFKKGDDIVLNDLAEYRNSLEKLFDAKTLNLAEKVPYIYWGARAFLEFANKNIKNLTRVMLEEKLKQDEPLGLDNFVDFYNAYIDALDNYEEAQNRYPQKPEDSKAKLNEYDKWVLKQKLIDGFIAGADKILSGFDNDGNFIGYVKAKFDSSGELIGYEKWPENKPFEQIYLKDYEDSLKVILPELNSKEAKKYKDNLKFLKAAVGSLPKKVNVVDKKEEEMIALGAELATELKESGDNESQWKAKFKNKPADIDAFVTKLDSYIKFLKDKNKVNDARPYSNMKRELEKMKK